MGVLVQQQVDADVAGVVATVDPLTGAPPAVVEASWGLGEAVVGGLVDPDRCCGWPAWPPGLVLLQARPLTGLPARAPRELTGPVSPLLLSGTPASRGRARGVARVVADPAGGGELRAGEVLVCRTTDPSWTPLLSVASAVVTETGGVLAHAAIVARERGIPAVVGAAGACTVLRAAPQVVVDGSAGTVESDACADVDAPPGGASTQ